MAKSDSIRYVGEHFVKRIHSNKSSGKLYKGHNTNNATASIPCKYQTVVIKPSGKKGFLSKANRFEHESSNENPGPGTYDTYFPTDKENTSFSKKGVGGLAAKVKRTTSEKMTPGPGAGRYGLPGLLQTRKDFNKSNYTAAFHTPIAKARLPRPFPAPNQYDVFQSKQTIPNPPGAVNAAFRSQTKRDSFPAEEHRCKPSPCQYDIQESAVKESVKVPFSSFKSKTRRQMRADPYDYPGPGTYAPHEPIEPVEKTLFPKKHYLCISAPAMPLEKPPLPPGPGTYEMVDYNGPSRHYMSGSAFVSVTTRWTGAPQEVLPGPAHYRPSGVGKQSFLYNINRKWL